MTDNAKTRIRDLATLVKASGQYQDVAPQFDLWLSMGSEASMIGIVLRRNRVKCPSCGMMGASFEACQRCGGPACDNCRNAAGRRDICSVCRTVT